MSKFHIKKNDTVVVIRGNYKGTKGRVLKIFSETSRAIVEKVNLRKKAQRPNKNNPQGGLIEKELPISISNLMLICNKCNQPTKTGRKLTEDKKRVRYCKKCNEIID